MYLFEDHTMYLFGCYNGHLSDRLRKLIERAYCNVSVVNYREPGGDRRGWFEGPNQGHPFDARLANDVLAFARVHARGKDRQILGADCAAVR